MGDAHSSLDRRTILELLAAGATAAWMSPLSGCGYYPAEKGVAFEPWRFPNPGDPPHLNAAHAAILAASPHNTQPWRLRVVRNEIELHADLARNLGTMDSLGRELHIGLGCALENLVVAARASGKAATVAMLPDPSTPTLVARVRLDSGERADETLFQHIAKRHTNRGPYVDTDPPRGLAARLSAIVDEQPGLQLRLLSSSSKRKAFVDQTVAATRAIIADAEMSEDSERWYRHTHEEIERERDGVTLDATGSGAVTRFLGKSFGRPDIATANRFWLDATRTRQTTGCGFGMITSSTANSRAEQLKVGRAFARLHLWAASEGFAVQPLNQLVERQDREETQALPPVFSRSLAELIGTADRRAQMLFRIGYPVDDALASPRRPLSWVSL